MKNLLIFSFIILIFIPSCSKNENTIDPYANMSDTAKSFLNEVLDVMEFYSFYRHDINWKDLRKMVFDSVSGAQTIDDTYIGVFYALKYLRDNYNDNHSHFITPNGSVLRVMSISCGGMATKPPSLTDIGYILVPSYVLTGNDEDTKFATGIQDQIRLQDNSDIIGWIVDLRGNGGGNMYPMLAGIGPLLGEGTSGYFVDPDNRIDSFGYSGGVSLYDNFPLCQVTDPYVPINQNIKIAILMDNGTASAGEEIVISFAGLENARSFGASTCGLTIGNSRFNLSNNSALILATSCSADRNLNKYSSFLNPDVAATRTNIFDLAIAWINSE